ncbi:lipopolysaccharide biosynthesis protein [Bradyrhizobium sp. CAR08]
MKREMLANNIASAGSIFWRIIGQLILPPALLAWWGSDRYGEWLFITSLPTLLAVADLGFADAAASQMTMEIARGQRSEAIRIFQTILAMTLFVCVGLIAAATPVLYLDHFEIGRVRLNADALAALYLVACYSSLLIVSRLFLASLRAGQHYAESTLVYDAIQFLEGVAILWAAYEGKSFFVCALLYVCIRVGNIGYLIFLISRRMSWLSWGFEAFDLGTFRQLFAPALAAMAMPIALALNFQGMIWIAGSTMGPAAAAVLATVRTASRVVIQLVGIFSRAAMPIYSASVAVNNQRSRDVIDRIMRLLLLFLLLPGCLAFGLFGRDLVGIWTHGHLNPPSTFVWLTAIGALFHGCWAFSANLLVSINRHVRFGFAVVVVTCIITPMAWPAAKLFGLDGIAVTLIVLEVATLLAFAALNDRPNRTRYQIWPLVRS